MRTIVVLLPGTTGSTLVESGQPYDTTDAVWPEQIMRKLEKHEEKAAEKELDRQDLWPGALTGVPAKNGTKGYAPFIQYFKARGYQAANAQYPKDPDPDKNPENWGLPSGPLQKDLLVAFPYDWRQDCTKSARLLQSLLQSVNTLYGNSEYQVYLVAHSMGGLVSRAYLESVGRKDSWYSRIAGLITLGTPHLGAPLALSAIMGQIKAGPRELDTLVHGFVDTSWSDSTFELLPPPVLEAASQPPLTQYIQDGKWYNLFDRNVPAEVTRAVEEAARKHLRKPDKYEANCKAAQAFFATLAYTGEVPAGSTALPPYYCVYGTDPKSAPTHPPVKTCVGFTYDAKSRSLPALYAISRKDDPNGDEIVPARSARFEGRTKPLADTYPAPGVNHFELPKNAGVLNTVFTWVTKPKPKVQVHKVVADDAEVTANA